MGCFVGWLNRSLKFLGSSWILLDQLKVLTHRPRSSYRIRQFVGKISVLQPMLDGRSGCL
ncbi:hypothetical protein [Alkalinema sp. FACHB-956]|uniref:hypothetical protein n=1 Tax=Alkalinema sp. FACHB-956 TaxID=2692768 RepID=UPI001685AC09|nr:hypothetical protein [Alkalinema sp. FACHB-956]MBD2329869.1 hypothetical protein [Alkalinema sp. FACHB-956]